MAFSREKLRQMSQRTQEQKLEHKNQIQSDRSEKFLETENAKDLVEKIKKESPLDLIKQILESEGDYLGLAKQHGLEERLKEIANTEGEDSEYYQFTQESEKNFYNSFVKYLRGQRNLDQMYLQSRRVANVIREMQKKGFQAPETLATLRKYNEELNLAEEAIENFTESNPEIFIASNIKRLRDYKREMESSDGTTGRINETPYVKKQLAQVESCIVDGKPIFIHGHLGAGKTEMALRASYKYLKENRSDAEIESNVDRSFKEWQENNPEATEEEKKQVLEEIKKESRTAVVISGSKETSTTDFTGHRTLNISTFEEEAKKMKLDQAEKEYQKWQSENPEATEAEQNMKWNGLLKVYLEKSGGTYSNFFIGPVYRAMREGRPVIIDEVDAIPHDSLIFLNHIMTRKPGDVLPVQGDSGQRVTVKDGFSVILTGNFPKADQVDTYVGRSQMDAAFLSRLQKLEHDYLPQSTDANTSFAEMSREDMKKNELFHVMVSSLIDRYGRLNLPEGEEKKLWRLACFSRHIQDIFSDKHVKLRESANSPQEQQELREKLHKEVLSMRQLLDIMREWQNPTAIRGKNEGLMQYELDHYVLEYFIKRTSEEETKWMLYKVAQQQFGLFQGQEWPDAPTDQDVNAGAGILPKFDIESPKNKSGELKQMLPSEVVEMCYGEIPEYDYGIQEKQEPESDFEKAIERERELDEMEKEMARLEKMRSGEISADVIAAKYIDKDGFFEDIELSIEANLERFSNFYTEHNIETPDNFNETITEIWNKNADKIKQAIEEEGFDDVLFIPPYDTVDINEKTTEHGDYLKDGVPTKTWTSTTIDNAGGIQAITDTKPNQPRIVLIHRKNAENLERPELAKTKDKSIYDLCNATTEQERENINNLIQNKQPLPIDGLTLGEYLIADRLHFKETGNHLDDWDRGTVTWLPASYAGSRVVRSCWSPADSNLYVDIHDSGDSHSILGARSSRTFSL
jgi:hypothetical protein